MDLIHLLISENTILTNLPSDNTGGKYLYIALYEYYNNLYYCYFYYFYSFFLYSLELLIIISIIIHLFTPGADFSNCSTDIGDAVAFLQFCAVKNARA